MNCDLIRDAHGWWLQYFYRSGGREIKRCTLMDATNETEAQLEAMQEGFTEFNIWYEDRQAKTVTVPKPPFP